jgi:hypothetical protein
MSILDVEGYPASDLQGVGTQRVADADQLPLSKVDSWASGIGRVYAEKSMDCFSVFLTRNCSNNGQFKAQKV